MRQKLPIPTKPEDVTLNWLNKALGDALNGHSVTDFRSVYADEPGQTAEVLDIHLTYSDENCTLPGRMVAKITSHNPNISSLVNSFGFYAREAQFYGSVQDVGLPTPTCYYSDYDPADNSMVILLEHLAPSESPSWGISFEQLKYACAALPEFHAKWWNHPSLLSMPFLNKMPSMDFLYLLLQAAVGAREAITNLYGDEANASIDCVEVFARKYDKVTEWISTRPLTMIHADYHSKQLFFPTEAGGQFAVIDWQYPFAAQGAWDLQRILSMCVDTGTRLAHQESIISDYVTGLQEHGVRDYTREDVLLDFQMGSLYSQTLMSVVMSDGDLDQADRECSQFGLDWRNVYFLWGDKFLTELNTLEFLEDL